MEFLICHDSTYIGRFVDKVQRHNDFEHGGVDTDYRQG